MTTSSRDHRRSVIDLRTDAITQPTPEMWRAMRAARLGWASAREDSSVAALETLAAELAGKEAAVFVPTGTMANLVALMTHTTRGDHAILEEWAHIFCCEEWSLTSICGLVPRLLPGSSGAMAPEDLERVMREHAFSHRPRVGIVCLENSHNFSGGTVLNRGQISTLSDVAHRYGVAVHLDAARIFNATVALGEKLKDLVASVDSLSISLNKGLSAPAGSVLIGRAEFIRNATQNLKRLGGASVSKAGILAAAGLLALRTMIPRLAEDHRRAKLLARGLEGLDSISIDMSSVQTNIVVAEIDERHTTPEAVLQGLENQDIRAYYRSGTTIRFVTHRHVSDESVHRVVEVMREVMRGSR